MNNMDILLWTIISGAEAEQVLQAFCWGKEANLPWLLHEDDGLRGAHVATSAPSGLRLLQVLSSSPPACTPAGGIECGATQLLCTDNQTDGNISLAISQCLDQLPSTGTSAGSQAPGCNGKMTESLLDLLPIPADQHADARSWGEAVQQVRERATPGSILEAAEAWLRLMWLDATYKHLQPVHAILTKHGRRLSDLQPLVAAIHASHRVQCPAQDQQQQKQQNLHLLQELLPGCQPQELHNLLALIGTAVVNLHPHPQQLQQQLIPIVTKQLQLFQVQVTGLHFAVDPAPVPAITAADQATVAAEEAAVAGVTASVHQAAAAKAADRKGQLTSAAVLVGRMKRSGPADATGSVSKKQREGAPGNVTRALQNLQSSPKPEAKQALGVDPLAMQPVPVAEAPAEQPAGVGGSSQDQQVAGPASQHQVAMVQHPADSSSPAAASTAAVAAPPSGAHAGVSKGSPVKLPPLRSPGDTRRAPVGRHISIKLAVNELLSGVDTATAPAAAVGAGAHVSDSAELDKQHLEARGVSAAAADAPAGEDATPGTSRKPPQQLAELAAKQERQQPLSVTQQQQQQQQSQPPAAADLGAGGGMFGKAPAEVYMPPQQKQARGEHSTGQLRGAAKQSAAGVPAAGAATGTAGGPSAAHSADAASTTARPASSGLSAGRHTAPAIHDGGIAAATKLAAATKQEVKQANDLGFGSVVPPPAPVEASKPAAGNGDTKSAATKECINGRHIVCTAATSEKVRSPAVSGAAAGRSSKPPDAAVARKSADTAVAAAADHALVADELHAAQQHSATSLPPTAVAADETNLVTPASGCATAVAPSSTTAASAERSAAKMSVRTDGARLTPAKRSSTPIPWSATPADRLASTLAVAQDPQGKESGAASGAGTADSAPPAKRARIPIPKPLIAGHSEPAAEKPAAAAGSDAPQYARAAPPTASATASQNKPDLRTGDEEYLLTLFDDFKAVHQQLKDIQKPQLQHTSSGTLVQLHWYLHHVDERMKKQLRDDERALIFVRKFPKVFRLQYPGSSGRAGDVLFGLQPGAEQWLREHLLEGIQPLLMKYKASLKQAIPASVDGKASMQRHGLPLSVAGTLVKEEGYMLPNLYPYTKLYPTFRSFVEARLCDEFSITEPCEGRQRELVLKEPTSPPAQPISRLMSRQLSSSSNDHQQTKQQRQVSAAPPHDNCHDQAAVAPLDGISSQEQLSEDLEFEDLVAEYRANLWECIERAPAVKGYQGVALASAGNPTCRFGLMSWELLGMCREKCGSFRNFVEQYLSDDFDTVEPDAERPGYLVLTLRGNTVSSATPSQSPFSTVPAAPGGAEQDWEPVADLRFLQLLTEYKDRLRQLIQQQEPVNGWRGVDPGKAGAPGQGIMPPELCGLKNKLGKYYLGMRTFVEDFLGKDFKLVRPDPQRPAVSLIVLRRDSRYQQHQMQLYDSAAAAVGAGQVDVLSESDSLAAVPASAVLTADPRANPVFLRLLGKYKGRLREYIRQEAAADGCWGVELGKAGNPQLKIMMPELFEYKNRLGYGMREFVKEFLRDEFKLIQPDPHCSSYYMIKLQDNSKHQQQVRMPADDTIIAAAGATTAFTIGESGSLADGEDQLFEQLFSSHQSQQQQLVSSLTQIGQEQLFAEHGNQPWLSPVLSAGAASALMESRPVGSVLRGLGSGHGAGSASQPPPPPPPPPPRASAAAGSMRHSAWSGSSVFERLSSPREIVPGHSASVHEGPQARRCSADAPNIPLQLAADLDLAIIAMFLQHAKEQQQAAMIFLEEGEVPTTLQVAPVTGLSTEDQHLIDSLGSFSMPCAVFTERLLQSSRASTVEQRALVDDWLGYLCDSGVLIQGSDAFDDAAAMTTEASMSIRLDLAAMLHRLLKHSRLQALIPQIEQALVKRLASKAKFPGHLHVPRLEVGKATECLREDLPQLRPYLLLPGFLRHLVRKSSLKASFWYGPSIKRPSMNENRLWLVEIRVPAAHERGFQLTECNRVLEEGACKFDDYCFFGHVRNY